MLILASVELYFMVNQLIKTNMNPNLTQEMKDFVLEQIKTHSHDGNFSQRINLFDVFGSIQSTVTEPTYTPKNIYDQFVIYNGTLYFYDFEKKTWYNTSSLKYSNITVPSGNTVSNTTTPTAFSSSYTFPADSLRVGNVISLKIRGWYGTDAVAPTLTMRIKLGSTLILDTGTFNCVAGISNYGWWAENDIIVNSLGSSGEIESQGWAEFGTSSITSLSIPAFNVATIALDTTTSQIMTVDVKWNTASTANRITLREMILTVN